MAEPEVAFRDPQLTFVQLELKAGSKVSACCELRGTRQAWAWAHKCVGGVSQ